jgi:hypothetical protein
MKTVHGSINIVVEERTCWRRNIMNSNFNCIYKIDDDITGWENTTTIEKFVSCRFSSNSDMQRTGIFRFHNAYVIWNPQAITRLKCEP